MVKPQQHTYSSFIMMVITASILLLSGCETLNAATNAGNSAANDSGNSTMPIALQPSVSPEEVARRFLDAWNEQNLPGMYDYLSAPSRDLYEYPIFENRYIALHENTNFSGVRYTINDVQLQGQTAAIYYDASIESPIFGTIEDPDRIMRLIRDGGQWRVAWTPMDIINGYASEVNLQIRTQFQPRAGIYDRNGEPLVDPNGTIMVLSLNKQDMFDENACIDLLVRTLRRRREEFVSLFRNYQADTIFHVGEIDPFVYEDNRAQFNDLCGTGIDPGPIRKIRSYTGRAYYGHGAAVHVTGYVGPVPGDQLTFWQQRGYQADDIVGRTGIEFAYDAQLSGTPERVLRMIEPGGTIIRELGGTAAEDPAPVMLTIDRDLQMTVAQAVNDAFAYAAPNWGSVARGAGAVVMDVNTGEILALYSYPSFDPGLFNPNSSYPDAISIISSLQSDQRYSPLSNKVVQETYTPGSIYKLFTAAAVAQEGIFTENIFDCQLIWQGNTYGDSLPFREDWRVAEGFDAAGMITLQQAIAASCNPFFWEMGGRMYQQDRQMQADYAELFGFGQATGMGELVREAPGNIARPNSSTEAINNAIGQGNVQVTALQMVRAVVAIANEGTLYEPYIVKQIGGINGSDIDQTFSPTVVRQLGLSPDVYRRVKEGMCLVPVDIDYGTATWAFDRDWPTQYSTCGKTGTAEAGVRGSGIPPHAWYVAYAPADDPQIAITVVVPNSREGSQVSAHIVRRIFDQYFDAPIKPFPDWWTEIYVPLEQPAGVSG